MRIHQIDLPVSDVAATVAYFRDELQLPVEGSAVGIGWSTLQLHPQDRVRSAVCTWRSTSRPIDSKRPPTG